MRHREWGWHCHDNMHGSWLPAQCTTPNGTDQTLSCANKSYVAHFLSYHRLSRETDSSYGNGNKLVVAWLLLLHYVTTVPTNIAVSSRWQAKGWHLGPGNKYYVQLQVCTPQIIPFCLLTGTDRLTWWGLPCFTFTMIYTLAVITYDLVWQQS